MDILEQLVSVAHKEGLSFLVIGGHAVIHHGYARTTDDLDFLIRQEDRRAWLAAVGTVGYMVLHDGGAFVQLKPPRPEEWPLDLMLVHGETFGKLLAQAEPEQIETAAVLCPSLNHLFALKLHALKHGHARRVLKDMDDFVQLVQANQVNVKAASFRDLVEKYGNSEIYERIVRICAEGQS
jgi:hypothetical protein